MNDRYTRQDPPLTLDELARRADIPATENLSGEARAGLTSARVTVTVPEWQSLQQEGGPTLVLPEGSFHGRTVNETRLHEPGSLAPPDAPPRPHRPLWQPQLHYPRLTGVPETRLRRINGRTVIVPTDSGHVYGEYTARQTYYPSGYPWACIGRLFVWSDASQANWDSYGTAALVGTRTVLTAAHMVPWGASNWAAQFVAGYYDGGSAAGSGGQSWVTDAHGYAGHDVSAHDMAVMRLADPLGSWLGSLGTKAYEDGWQGGNYWTLVGYPSAVTSERPSFQAAIHVIDDDEDGDAQELEHHGDDTGGDSGGPFFGTWGDGPYAIGTVSGYEEISGPLGIGSEDNNIVAGGPDLNAIVKYGRDTWP
ncbi:trypsin-like serine peptidase [Streptomyces sp. NPDC001691]|uniref:trypsin-like serine peptidase n=1 Tax=Streptomyces sp. NPDC001691 TaxID=3364600 RepID=UPI0036780E0D